MKFSRREKILMWLVPYWCKYCKRRFRRLEKYHQHYLKCDYEYQMRVNQHLERIAPVNREQKRKMAKKAGKIKEWGDLNA